MILAIISTLMRRSHELNLCDWKIYPRKISCSFLNYLPRLTNLHLSVNERDYVSHMGLALSMILGLPVLKRCTIINGLDVKTPVPKIVLPTAVHSKASPIEYLTIDDVASAGTIVSLIRHMPNIRYLNCELFAPFNELSGELETIYLPHLKQFSMRHDSMNFDQVEILIKSLFHHVEIFKLEETFDGEYVDAGRWERLIKNYLPRLKIFDMKCLDINPEDLGPTFDMLIHFYSEFWLEHEWFPSVTFGPYDIQFFIHSYR